MMNYRLASLVTMLAVAFFSAMPNQVLASGQALEEAKALLKGEMAKFQLHDEPRELPYIAVTDEAGNPVSLADFSGRVVLLNIWATWCAPCVAEMPSLNALQERAAGTEFDVVPLSVDRGSVVVQKFYNQHELRHLLIFMDEAGNSVSELEVGGLPTSILIDHNGREVGRFEGDANWNSDDVIRLIGAYVRAARRQDS
ncbi:MAG: redoxin [Alphaproteobacteria bacterium]|nr:redoxin [Alphaproteobacteria bacterium]MAS46670.1 redoxin [Alphaproteobacteria bacterium]MAX94764.1 redoxin [Alphaproteobacteria bacterium]MBN53784.1 redoxin [Alphaproteobacteria bacterium]OUT41751.1 MAG: hypothetical protein CBB62_05385 [Micavibrio sp. TMED2]|tara:strand:+ start:329 stop:922 length:594 start_codon:yes stop_codon:yes gene_type:complete